MLRSPSFPAYFFCLIAALICSPANAADPTVKIPEAIEFAPGTANDDPSLANRPCLIVELEGVAAPVRLPVETDTCLLKNGDQPKNKATDVQIRDNRWHQGLYKFDLSALPTGKRIAAARFEFTIGWVERKGGARIELHRVLTAWAPEATWKSPATAGGPAWNGMATGRDYEAEAVGTYETAEAVGGTRVAIAGLAALVDDWRSGRKPNHGVVMQLFGRATQLNIVSNETTPKKPQLREIRLSPNQPAPVRAGIDLDVLRRLVLSVDDIRGVDLRLTLGGSGDLSKVQVDAGAGRTARIDGRELLVSGLQNEIIDRIRRGERSVQLDLTLKTSAAIIVGGPDSPRERRPVFLVEIRDYPKAQLWKNPVAPRPGVYVESRDGQLYYGGERLRLWGSLGYGSIPRMKRMGFNAWRVWPVGNKGYDAASIRTGDLAPTAKGDGSEWDNIDRMYGEFKANGFFLMATQLMGVPPPNLLSNDDSFVAGGADWEEWKAAVKALPKGGDAAGSADFRRMGFVDERVRAARFRHAANFLNRVNPYTGKRYAEEESIAIWELDNELGFVRHVIEGGALKWPAYFKAKFDAKWTAWVRKRYQSEAALMKAWGRLDAGESYAALKAGPALAQAAAAPKERASDFVRFILELTDGFYQDLRAACRAQAPAGVGVASAAFSFDTQYRPNLPWLYQQTRGDVSNFGMYFWDNTSHIARAPGAYVMDSSTVENKVTVIYETNHSRPSPYRAEFPYRLAALAAWQDWDAIFFHYWGGNGRAHDEEFMTWPMKYMTTDHYWDAVHHDQDPAMTSAMAVAGRMFVEGMIPAATNPATYRVGAKGIFSYVFANGLGMREDTFSRGARLRFEPEGDFDLIKENSGGDAAPAGAVRSGDAITWDWPEGRLIIDSPRAIAYVGPAPREGWRFKNGVTLSGVSTPWISFGLVSADGLPIAESKRLEMTSVFNAVNTDFAFDWNVQGGPIDQAKAITNRGRAPIIVDKVDYTLSFPRSMQWKVTSYDFALRELSGVNGESNVIRVRANPAPALGSVVSTGRSQETWMNVVQIGQRGSEQPAVVDASPGAESRGLQSLKVVAEVTDPALAGLWNPLPGVTWGDNYPMAHRKLREMTVRNTGVSRFDPKAGDEAVITVSDAYAVFDAPALTEIAFSGGRMNRIVVTFVQPPVFREAVAAYEQRFGKPVEKQLTDDQFSQSTVRWKVAGQAADLSIQMTDAQGVMKIVFTVLKK